MDKRLGFRGARIFLALLIVCSSLAATGAASAATQTRLKVAVPRAVLSKARVELVGRVKGPGRDVVLEARKGHRWVALGKARVQRRHRFKLRFRAPHSSKTLVVRLVVFMGRHVVARSHAYRMHVSTGKFAPGKAAAVPSTSRVAALPPLGQAGTVVLQGNVKIKPGQVLVLGYSAGTPDGFLGRVVAVTNANGQTILQTVPATLEQAGAVGTLDLSTFHEVLPNGAIDRAPLGAMAHIASGGGLNQDILKGISCNSSASASVKGSISFSISPSLDAHFSLFSGLTSASFTVTGTATASVVAQASASGSCGLDRTPVLASPIHIGTFVGAIGPIPVVIVIEGQIFVDAGISGDASVCTSVTASASMTGGVGYDNGSFHPILNGPNTSFNFHPPGVSASANAHANIEPAVDALLYGVGGPELGLKAGLAFNADIHANPWWSLSAPLSLEASLTAPVLGLNSGTLTLFSHEFPITAASGPFPGYGIPNGNC